MQESPWGENRDALVLSKRQERRRYAAMMSGLDIHYDLGPGHPLLGRRMPDLEVVIDGGPRRVFTLLHAARPVLLDFGEALDITPWADRVQRVDARYAGAWELPVLGAVAAPAAVLIRPDGHVAWVGDGTEHGLREAITGGSARRAADEKLRGVPGRQRVPTPSSSRCLSVSGWRRTRRRSATA